MVMAKAKEGRIEITHAVSSRDSKYDSGSNPSLTEALRVSIGLDPAEPTSAWLARFGRTVAGQVLDAVQDRADRMGGSGSGTEGTVVGLPLPSGPASPAPSRESGSSGFRDVEWRELAPEWHELAPRTSFSMVGQTASGSRYGFWGRGVQGRFDGSLEGSSGTVSLSGETTTLMAGRDTEHAAASGRMLLGAMLAHSRTRGSFSESGEAREIDADLTSLVPYGALELGAGLRVWGSLGAGSGEVRVSRPGGGHDASDTEWRMAGTGFRRSLHGTVDGMGLWVRGDVRYSRTSADLFGVSVAGSSVQARLGLGGEWPPMAIGAKWNPERRQEVSTWQPRWSISLRHDGGDAEEGLGAEIGAGVDWRFAGGLEIGINARSLATHEDDGFRDRGVSVVLEYDPRPDTARGFSGRFGLDAGGGAQDDGGGSERLFGSDILTAGSIDPQTRTGWRAEGSYGLHRHRHGLLGSPYLSLSGSGHPETTRMGYRVSPDFPGSPNLEMDLFMEMQTTGHEQTGSSATGLELQLRW